MSRTGDMSERDGYYRATCCNRESVIRRGDKFPSCKLCNKVARWTFIRPWGHNDTGRAAGTSSRHPTRSL